MKKLSVEIIIREVFWAVTGALVLFVILEVIKPFSVLSYFNLNYLVILWIITALAVIFRRTN